VPGITHPYLNVGRIEGGSNTNVVPGKVVLKLDRRMIPEEDAAEVEAEVRALISRPWRPAQPGIRVDIRRLLLAAALKPLPGNERWSRPCSAWRRRCSASRSRPAARRCTPTCGCTAHKACRP
jgi:acetylornithine deacetylase/succinyl-diaminopimelate desuccinylase-like protein